MSTLNVGTINTSVGVKLPSYTSGARPVNPQTGLMIYNTTKNLVEFWDGTIWSNFESGAVVASGGTVTDVGGYRIHTFTGNGTFTVTQASQNALVEYLIVAGGGGGGGGYQGGGGGAGGMLEGVIPVSTTSYPIVIGAGGRGASNGLVPLSGQNSSAFGLTAIGGGNGSGEMQAYGASGAVPANPGGSGGGTGHSVYQSAQQGVRGQGNAGGTGVNCCSSSGGGGANGIGGDAGVSSSFGGAGGIGRVSSISGTGVFYAGGGAGCVRGSGTIYPGGQGGGGGGRGTTQGGINGTNGLGGGGGGGGDGSGQGPGGAGGSGIVIIRYRIY